MTDPTNERHPNNMTQADKDALRASDPAAFEDDDTDTAEPEKQEPATLEPAKEEGKDEAASAPADAGKPAPAGTQDGAAEGEDGGKRQPPTMVPKARLNEVLEQRDAAKALAEQNARELAELRARLADMQAPKDFDAEHDALRAKYDQGEIDDTEFQRAQTKLVREEAAHAARIAAMEAQKATIEQVQERSWKEELKAWAAQNPGFFAQDGAGDVFQRAINSTIALYGDGISNADLLREASVVAFRLTGYTPPQAGGTTAPAADERRNQNARRAAEGSTTPPLLNGGVGGRGGPERNMDVSTFKPGTFSKLSKDEQERLLGEGAV